jgi:glycosyltransferase involved in cell wall biosynthesis
MSIDHSDEQADRVPRRRVMISFVVATLNSKDRLVGLVRCFQTLTMIDAELVVVDGGSADGTAEWLAREVPVRPDSRIVWSSKPDAGIADAWNKGIPLSSGQWLLFLGADDRLSSEKVLQSVVELLWSVPDGVMAVGMPVEIVSPSGTLLTTLAPRLGSATAFPVASSLPHQGVFHRRDIWRRLGPFDTSFKIASDYEFLLRAWANGLEIRVLESAPPPVQMCFGGLSKESPLRNLAEFRAIRRAYGINQPRLAELRDWLKATVRAMLVHVCGRDVANSVADLFRAIAGRPRCWAVK